MADAWDLLVEVGAGGVDVAVGAAWLAAVAVAEEAAPIAGAEDAADEAGALRTSLAFRSIVAVGRC
ncbi:MAG: hypothetical protein GC150_11160 [Rhizobiales bacterium]|nr:hypothetical protein [Hyphomicrobiales bacterium]